MLTFTYSSRWPSIHPSNHPKSANNKLPRTEADVNDGALIAAAAADAYSAEQAADVQMLPMPIHNNCPVFNSLYKSILALAAVLHQPQQQQPFT